MYREIKTDSSSKCYKKRSTCKICGKRYTIDKDSDVYEAKYLAKYYCKDCYENKVKDEESKQEEE